MKQYNKYLSNHLGKIHRGDEKDFLLMEKYFSKNYLKYLPRNKQSLIVDLGCGMGHFLYFLKKMAIRTILALILAKSALIFVGKRN
jgi:tRNA G46 methylase TrmB